MKQRSKQQYRSSLQILIQIMGIIASKGRDGASISAISRDASAGHAAVLEKCQKLIDAGLVTSTNGHKSRRYYCTEDGIHFFGIMNTYRELLDIMNNR